ncbi:MAG: 2-C-methyl-D-erythritol 2,4-cyclodiphosphate synthase [Deltaproteobacteria bacterium]|nr:2-C-methyl-D-erythritol 2,4-cyclodiphosphate synthase [Deltaproteobacteria bacterium]MBW2649684.1 2-C-methyl-D-erythritol 2,4-cyclodiphosphate synthase [Deltaproteobacteria bacterium]
MRVGFGYDSHRLVTGRKLILGGVEISHEKGLLGHSDADVLLHALCDAILGAIGEGDLGRHFPDSDPAYKDIPSRELLVKVNGLAARKGYLVNNIDSTLVLEKPKLRKYINKMVENIADFLDMEPARVNVKASTNEGMGFTGRCEGIAAFAVVTMRSRGQGSRRSNR